jgi:MtN3 and saliva related transmembrane protein
MLDFLKSNLGYFAGILTTIAFIPQVVKVWTSKSTSDISLIMFVVFTSGVLLWFIYGIIINDYALVITNLITFSLSLSILVAKILYK